MHRQIDKIIIHCTATRAGSLNSIRKEHKKRGWIDIGYHYLVLNQFSTYKSWLKHRVVGGYVFNSTTDGLVVTGRSESMIGSHVKGHNLTSIGIAYVGITPTPAQYTALALLTLRLAQKHQLSIDDCVFGHHEMYALDNVPMKKTCPNFNMESFRDYVKSLYENA